ncbi:alkyl hydroperoxide reductase subunit F [Dokdonella ginsengisoli]|uniref:Alkyl hydroperoxide reductase subunit F n=1 Tax=Dokdonella ginsengisoli TaxID=363846 RepID=A0ABV9QPM2_9GAMM
MLDDSIKTQLQEHFARIERPVDIVAALDGGEKSQELRELLTDIAGLSPQFRLVERAEPGIRMPSFALSTPGQDIHLRFSGIPMGHEFTSLILALLQVGGHPPKLAPETIEQIRALDGEYKFETYVSLSCQSCPDVVQALNLMATLNPRIGVEMIEGATFEQEVTEKQILSVPAIFLNGQEFGQGRMGVEEILAKLDSGADAREAEKLDARAPYDVLVVGGGPAGAAAAIYAARKGIRTGVVAERFGGQVLDTMEIANYISVTHTEGSQFAAALEAHVKDYDVDIVNRQRADKLVADGDLVRVELASGAALKSRTVVLATGARWRNMNVPGESEYRTKGVTYCPHCDGPLFKGKRVAVIGGGNSGIEAAIDLAGVVAHVTVLEFDSKLRADEVLQRKLRSLPNVDVILGAQTTEVVGDGSKVTGLKYTDRASGQSHDLELSGVFVQIGLLPNTDWLKGALALSPRGEIEVDAHGRTSMAGVFAAGDATTTPFKQIVIAAGEGAKAALAAFDHLIRAPIDGVAADAEKKAA